MNGIQYFNKNVAEGEGYGGAIHALRTRIEFYGNHYFTENMARYGGGLAMFHQDYYDCMAASVQGPLSIKKHIRTLPM